MREWWSKFGALFGRRRAVSRDLDEELRTHLEFEIEENLSRGMPPEQAQNAARTAFGNKTLIEENARHAWAFPAIENFFSDLVYGWRAMRKAPVFVVAAILTLALGIGANTAIFTVIRTVLLKPLEYRQPGRLVRVSISNARENYGDIGFSLVRFNQMKAAARSFTDLGAFFIATEHMTLGGGAQPEQVSVARVSANFLHILGIEPLLGRSFRTEEDRSGGPLAAMISVELWKRRFHEDPLITSRTLDLNAQTYAIVGVLPEGFAFPSPGLDVWVTRPAEYSEFPPQFWPHLVVLIGLGRLKPHVTLDQARAELEALNRQYVRAHPGLPDAAPGVSLGAVLLRDQLVANVRSMLWTLFGAVGFVLIIACSNVASLLLARAASRAREFAVRAALGAGRGRLIRQLLAESLLLSSMGGIAGVLLAKVSLKALSQVSAFHLPRAGEIHVDTMVLAFSLVLSIVTGLVFGLFPSLQISRPALGDLLRDRAGDLGRARTGVLGIEIRSLLVIGQVALSVMLLIGAALLLKSFFRLHDVKSGFQSAHLLTMRIDLPPARYNTPQKKQNFFDQLVARVDAIPGVVSSAAVLTLPLSPVYETAFQVAEQPAVKVSERPAAQLQSVTPGYFRTAGIRLLRGREFTARDNMDRALLALIINESFARRFWSDYPRGRDPVGEHLFIGNNTSHPFEIIGIAADVHERGFATAAGPELYLPDHSYPLQSAGFLVRTHGDPGGFVNAVQNQVLAIDREQPVASPQTMQMLLESSVGQQRLTLLLLGSFAAMALLLAAVGMYGLIAYSVVRRTQELGVRRALGAQTGDILRLVIGRGLGLTFAGLIVGLAGAFALTRVMAGLLFDVSPTDPVAFLGVALLFVAVALLASYLPAWRATRVDPMFALR